MTELYLRQKNNDMITIAIRKNKIVKKRQVQHENVVNV